jgi:hypothetical protein
MTATFLGGAFLPLLAILSLIPIHEARREEAAAEVVPARARWTEELSVRGPQPQHFDYIHHQRRRTLRCMTPIYSWVAYPVPTGVARPGFSFARV